MVLPAVMPTLRRSIWFFSSSAMSSQRWEARAGEALGAISATAVSRTSMREAGYACTLLLINILAPNEAFERRSCKVLRCRPLERRKGMAQWRVGYHYQAGEG